MCGGGSFVKINFRHFPRSYACVQFQSGAMTNFLYILSSIFLLCLFTFAQLSASHVCVCDYVLLCVGCGKTGSHHMYVVCVYSQMLYKYLITILPTNDIPSYFMLLAASYSIYEFTFLMKGTRIEKKNVFTHKLTRKLLTYIHIHILKIN